MVKKVGICWHFKTIQTPIRLDASTDTNFSPVFQAIFFNKNDISAIINAKFAENHAIFDQKRSFLHYFDWVSECLILAVQFRPKFLCNCRSIGNGVFWKPTKMHPPLRHFQNWRWRDSTLYTIYYTLNIMHYMMCIITINTPCHIGML